MKQLLIRNSIILNGTPEEVYNDFKNLIETKLISADQVVMCEITSNEKCPFDTKALKLYCQNGCIIYICTGPVEIINILSLSKISFCPKEIVKGPDHLILARDEYFDVVNSKTKESLCFV